MTAYELIFVLDEVGELGDPRVDAVEAELDALFERHGDLCLATISAEAASAYSAAVEGVRHLVAAGFAVRRSYPDLVNRAEVAERLGVTRQAVGNWIRGERQSAVVFPSAVHLAAGGLWLWGDVIDWCRASGCEITDGDLHYPSIDDHAAIDSYIQNQRRWPVFAGNATTTAYTFAVTCLPRVTPNVPSHPVQTWHGERYLELVPA